MSLLTEMIIEAVKVNPILYDVDHEEFKNIKKKNEIWNAMGKELKETGDTLKKKWRNIKDTHAKYLKANNWNGEGSPKKKYKNWQWGPLMEFFKPFLASRTYDLSDTACSQSTHQSDSEPDSDENESVLVPETCQNDECQRGRECCIEQKQSAMPSTASLILRNPRNRRQFTRTTKRTMLPVDVVVEFLNKKEKLSPIQMVFMGYAGTVDKFSMERQITTKMKVSEVIMQQEMLHTAEIIISNKRKENNDNSESSEPSVSRQTKSM
ncbi:PREDICTED: uncharacterized protein LOC108563683 [Nicrophorus vespilloides]|uniref:Uncharacterized protein LOC108563683 n=1 Tax=Nicrophorus vespilloides TaxID=110193 RepID=A0ABM1MTL7_NICVS|nr:PREDICTED: uncharacterized protein LOC108563683 [Nicrophorus vespilloides]